MGAETCWCWSRYRNDVLQTFQEAQQEVFQSGEYRKPWADIQELDHFGFFEADAEEQEDILSQYGFDPLRPLIAQVGVAGLPRRLEELNDAPALNSLEDVQAVNCLYTDGTASLIDVRWLAPERESGAAAPVSSENLLRLYGTERPTRSQVETNMAWTLDLRRGETLYIVVYQDDVLTEICFVGKSYD